MKQDAKILNIKRGYKFNLVYNNYNDSAIATFSCLHLSAPYSVVLQQYTTIGIHPFFDTLMQDPDIKLTCAHFMEDLYHQFYPDRFFKDIIIGSGTKLKIFRTTLKHVTFVD